MSNSTIHMKLVICATIWTVIAVVYGINLWILGSAKRGRDLQGIIGFIIIFGLYIGGLYGYEAYKEKTVDSSITLPVPFGGLFLYVLLLFLIVAGSWGINEARKMRDSYDNDKNSNEHANLKSWHIDFIFWTNFIVLSLSLLFLITLIYYRNRDNPIIAEYTYTVADTKASRIKLATQIAEETEKNVNELINMKDDDWTKTKRDFFNQQEIFKNERENLMTEKNRLKNKDECKDLLTKIQDFNKKIGKRKQFVIRKEDEPECYKYMKADKTQPVNQQQSQNNEDVSEPVLDQPDLD